jgi:hypothetical protein
MGRRDSRADLIDDDPFSPSYRAKSRVRHIHQRTDEQGTIHFDTKSPGNQLPPAFAQFFGQQAWQPPSHHAGPLWHFSKEEKAHLRQAMGAFTLALGFMSVGGISGLGSRTHKVVRLPFAFNAGDVCGDRPGLSSSRNRP